MRKTLITQTEITKVIEGLKDVFPKCDLKDIKTVEEYLFNCKLGRKFYKELKDSLCEYECKEYEDGLNVAGNVVVYNGVFRIALVNTNTLPSNHLDWENAPKFCGDKADCFNEFWCDYLQCYLAWYIMAFKVLGMGSVFSSFGSHVKNFDPSSQTPATQDEHKTKVRFYNSNVKMAWVNLQAFIGDCPDNCFENFGVFKEACCNTKGINRGQKMFY